MALRYRVCCVTVYMPRIVAPLPWVAEPGCKGRGLCVPSNLTELGCFASLHATPAPPDQHTVNANAGACKFKGLGRWGGIWEAGRTSVALPPARMQVCIGRGAALAAHGTALHTAHAQAVQGVCKGFARCVRYSGCTCASSTCRGRLHSAARGSADMPVEEARAACPTRKCAGGRDRA